MKSPQARFLGMGGTLIAARALIASTGTPVALASIWGILSGMARPIPTWRAPYIRRPGAGAGIGPAMLAKRTAFGDFSEGSGRRQCVAVAKSTGQRCGKDAVQGVDRCASHGGKAHAVRKAKVRDPRFRPASGDGSARRGLAVLGFDAVKAGEAFPDGGIVAAGRTIEKRRNRKPDG